MTQKHLQAHHIAETDDAAKLNERLDARATLIRSAIDEKAQPPAPPIRKRAVEGGRKSVQTTFLRVF